MIIHTFLLVGLFAAALAVSQPDVQKVGAKIDRLGANELSSTIPYRVYDPFKRAKPLILEKNMQQSATKETQSLRLDAIMNHKAFINGKWVKEGQRVLGSTILRIKQESILVRSGDKKRWIPLAKGRTLLTTKDRDQ